MAKGGGEEGILLYYKYASIPDVSELLHFYQSNCESLQLLGRVRLAPDGVNATVGGKLSALKKHISAVKSNKLFEGTDFKLASCHSPSNDIVAKECGFTSLSIRVVKELVTFSSHPLLDSPSISNAGRHLSAKEFHSVLQSAGNSLDPGQDKQLVLLDARNVYETRIGKFEAPHVESLDPEIRQYSDLPAWIDDHSKQLEGNCILMYCTGGIRCEMASAYIRSKGAGFENVFQLFGGIQRYLEHFPDGGFFRGKNFVFDHRISVGSLSAGVVGLCLICGSSFDDYSSRCRCTYCRMLILVCNNCQGKAAAAYICELCQKNAKGGAPVLRIENDKFDSKSKCYVSGAPEIESATLSDDCITSSPVLACRDGNMPLRKLRILCLHGFRQNASNFRGRTASLAKKLKHVAEFVYVDAPHELPFVYLPCSTQLNHGPKEASSPGRIADGSPAWANCKRKFAWLIAPDYGCPGETDWKVADQPFDPLQYRQQTDGFEESYAYLKAVFSEKGPFDGVLGFSQGAAMAALVCAKQGKDDSAQPFRFVILCSGFHVNSGSIVPQGSIKCPSLHIFGGGWGKDRQIAHSVSVELASLFEEGSSIVIEHESGHIIPTQCPYIDRIKDFLERFR